ncbi:SUPPRESSOR OF ABI3-5 [Asparagus officinalis]|nr:SUPPRESSOR OF ABI3-5 [Asparagus officinalis]
MTFDKIQDEGSESRNHTSIAGSEPVENKKCEEEHFMGDGLENQQPPSEWLEETLINIYLSGNSNLGCGAQNSTTLQGNEEEQSLIPCGGPADQFASDELPGCHQVEQVEEAWITEDEQNAFTSISSEEGASLAEETWQAQYGQVVRVEDEGAPRFPIIDLWDWELIAETLKKRRHVARLFGRVTRNSHKLHQSAPRALLKTAPICDVHLDLVRVTSGKVYKLRTPSKHYLDKLSAYESSNPTKDWGFPDLFVNMHNIDSVGLNQTYTNTTDAVMRGKSSATLDLAPPFQKCGSLPYRDRAAERRALHGGYSIGPGQKNLGSNLYEEEWTSQNSDPAEAAAEAMNMTFGKGSYARRVIEKMGWKEGEALGCTNKGLLEPLQAVPNKGYAGLGWNHTR